MKFKDDEDNFICEDCLEEFPDDYRAGYEDEEICCRCFHDRYLAWQEEPCAFCGKPMKEDDSDPYYDGANERSAHGKCYKENEEKIPEDELDEWYRMADMY